MKHCLWNFKEILENAHNILSNWQLNELNHSSNYLLVLSSIRIYHSPTVSHSAWIPIFERGNYKRIVFEFSELKYFT